MIEEFILLGWAKKAVGKTGGIQCGPETIAGPGKVMTGVTGI
jgi:hypothetical protein